MEKRYVVQLTLEQRSDLQGRFCCALTLRQRNRIQALLRYTAKHASWLNMAEMEFSVLQRQCLDRRISSRAKLATEIAAWQEERNRQRLAINWQFRVADARVKLDHLYPKQPL